MLITVLLNGCQLLSADIYASNFISFSHVSAIVSYKRRNFTILCFGSNSNLWMPCAAENSATAALYSFDL